MTSRIDINDYFMTSNHGRMAEAAFDHVDGLLKQDRVNLLEDALSNQVVFAVTFATEFAKEVA
jgi:hypothetical protein